jgi:hypothetical protein
MDTAIKNHTEATMVSVSYVGMDVHNVHKDTVDMVVMREDSQEPTLEMRIHNDRKSIERFFWKLPEEGSGDCRL